MRLNRLFVPVIAVTVVAVTVVAAVELTPVVAQERPVFLSRSLSQVHQAPADQSATIQNAATRADIQRMLTDAGMLTTETAVGFRFRDRRRGQGQIRLFELVLEAASMRLIYPLEGAFQARLLTRAQMNALMQANTQVAPFSFAVDPAAQRLQLERRLPAVVMPRAELMRLLDTATLSADQTASIWRVGGAVPGKPRSGSQSVSSGSSSPSQVGTDLATPPRTNASASASPSGAESQPAVRPWWEIGSISGRRTIMVRERPTQTIQRSNPR